MREAVLDASVVLKWFHQSGEAGSEEACRLRHAYEAGELFVFAPPLLFLEIMNVAGRRWGFSSSALMELATQVDRIGFELEEPGLEGVARWMGSGLTAYDAAYVALAETLDVRLVTDDDLIIRIAPNLVTPLRGR